MELKDSIKVLYLTVGGNYGAPKSLQGLCECLKGKNIRVFVGVNDFNSVSQFSSKGIKTYYVPFARNTYNPRGRIVIRGIGQVIKKLINVVAEIEVFYLIRKLDVDILHVNSAVIDVGTYAARKKRIKVVRHLREFVEEDFDRKFINSNKTYHLMDEADCVIAVSEAVKNKYESVLSHDIEVIYNGINPERFIGRHVLFCNDKIGIIIVGQLIEGKGHLALFQALSKSDFLKENTKVSVVGDGDYQDRLIKYVNDNNLKNVTFYGFRENVYEFLKNNDICVVPSRAEAFGRVTVEALMAGTIVLGANTAATCELLSEGKGILYQNGDVDSLEKKLLWIIDNKEESKKIANRGREFALNNLTAKKKCNDYLG